MVVGVSTGCQAMERLDVVTQRSSSSAASTSETSAASSVSTPSIDLTLQNPSSQMTSTDIGSQEMPPLTSFEGTLFASQSTEDSLSRTNQSPKSILKKSSFSRDAFIAQVQTLLDESEKEESVEKVIENAQKLFKLYVKIPQRMDFLEVIAQLITERLNSELSISKIALFAAAFNQELENSPLTQGLRIRFENPPEDSNNNNYTR